MTTRVTVDTYGTHVTVQVTDDTGRFEIRKFPRYPDKGSAPYVRFADTLDAMMASPATYTEVAEKCVHGDRCLACQEMLSS